MIDVTLICSAADREAADSIACRLDREAEARVWVEELRAGESVVDLWDRGSTSAGLLLLLSPDSVPARSTREDWAEVLEHVERGDSPEVGTVLLGACPFPPILRRRNAFSLAEESMRALVRWAVALHREDCDSFVPARIDGGKNRLANNVVFRARELEAASMEAQATVVRVRADFRQTLWVLCADRPEAEVASEIAYGLGLPLDRADFAACERLLQQHRILLVLDDVRSSVPVTAGGRGCVIATTTDSRLAVHGDIIDVDVDRPLIEEPSSLHALLFWRALSACRPQRSSLRLAEKIAGCNASEELLRLGIAVPIDAAGEYCRLRLRAPIENEMRQRHAEVMTDLFGHWSKDSSFCRMLIQEIGPAYHWARDHDWHLARALTRAAFRFLHAQHRNAEVGWLLELAAGDAQTRGDEELLEWCAHELSWLGRFPLAPGPAPPGIQLGFSFAS